MAVSVSKAGPYYASGQISFSSLRSNFRAQQRKATSGGSETFNTDNTAISASDLLRITDTTEETPIVPDATENSSIVSSESNWKTSQFRNSIKYYYIAQSGTNTNFDIDAQSWNTNLNKNIVKVMFIDGTCGSSTASSSAAAFNATAHNLTVDVYGNIYGASGRGGGTGSGAPSISGQAGGNALSMTSSGGNNVVVLVRSGARIYGGGGGGEKGKKGANGSGGRCYNETTTSGCGGAPGCPGGYSDRGTWGGGCCQTTCDWCWGCCERCVNYTQYRRCVQEYNTSGGTGGAGGNGGLGRGYNNQSGSLSGAGGSAGGSGGGCGAQSGQTGETGGAGGEWATSGSNTNNSGNGGGGGRAISGSNYSITGTINSSTVKGAYNP